MLDIFSNKIEPVNFEQESEIIKSQITELLSDIDSKLRYRRKQPTRSDIENLEERYKKIKEKLKKLEENFKKEISKLKLDRSNLNGKNFQQNTDVQAFSNNSSSTTKITKMNNIINKFTDNKRKFLIELITKNKAFSEIQNIYTNSNVNKINNKRLENATKSKNIPKNSGELFKSIIKLHKLLNSLKLPNSPITLRKILLNVTVKYVTDKLKLINEKKNFLLSSNENGNENGNINGNINDNEKVNPQVEKFESYKKIALSSEIVPRKSTRSTKGKPPPQSEGMLFGKQANAALKQSIRMQRPIYRVGGTIINKGTQRRQTAPPNAGNQSSSQNVIGVLERATGKLVNLGATVSGGARPSK